MNNDTNVIDKKIHILFFLHNLAPFGGQRVFLYLVKYLNKSKFRVTVCSFWGEETLREEFQKCGAEVVLLRARRFFDISAWLKFIKFIRFRQPDIIQASIPELGTVIRLFVRFFTKARIIFTFQNPLHEEQIVWRILNKITLGLCDTITFVSSGIAEEILKDCASVRKKSLVIPNGILLDSFLTQYWYEACQLRKEWNVKDGEKVLCCIGRVAKQKGQDVLIKAMQILVRKKAFVKLVIVGDGDMEVKLRGEVQSLQIEKKVLFLGRRKDIPQILFAIDIYVAPSRWEGMPLTLLEAMASGKICIASDIPGHKDLMDNKKTGVVINKDDEQSAVDAIEWVLNNEHKAKQMAITAQQGVKNDFTAEKMARKYQDLYLRIMSKTQ